jgi:hypothetical protein
VNQIRRFEHSGPVGARRHDHDIGRSELIIDHEGPAQGSQNRPLQSGNRGNGHDQRHNTQQSSSPVSAWKTHIQMIEQRMGNARPARF